MNSYGSLPPCSHLRFQQVSRKKFFFNFYAFVIYEPAERNFIFLACCEHNTQKFFFFNWLHFFFTWLLLYHKEVTQVFSSTLNFARQFSYQWNWQCAILPQSQICKFGSLIARRGPDLFNYTSSSVAFFLMQCKKSTVMFPTRPCILFACGQDLFQQFLHDLSAKGICICCRIQQKIHETHKICLWLERIRSLHKEFAYLLYNSTENTWNSQNLAS